MRNEKKNQREEYDRDEMQNIGEVEEKEKDLDSMLKELQLSLETSKKQLIENYELKLENL
jgi:hypothetical protein